MNHGGAWNKTHESGWFLEMTRTMLLTERGNELWLAPFVTSNWLKDWLKVAVSNAPSRFGPVSYRLASSVDRGFIEAEINLHSRVAPERIVLRVRHPQGKMIQRVFVGGKPHAGFDRQQETVTLPSSIDPIAVRIEYN